MDRYQAIIIGAGVNGLICAVYLAKAGRRVLVLGKPAENMSNYSDGWQSETEFIFPKITDRIDRLETKVFRDLSLAEFGLRVRPLGGTVSFSASGEPFYRDPEPERMMARLAKKSHREASAYGEYLNSVSRQRQQLDKVLAEPQGWQGYLARGREFDVSDTLGFLSRSVREVLNDHFETDALRDHLCASALGTHLVHMGQGPMAPTSASALLFDSLSLVSQATTLSGLPEGGPEQLSAALRRALTHFGGEFRETSDAMDLLVKNGKVVGVTLENGDNLYGKTIISDQDLKRTVFTQANWGDLGSSALHKLATIRTRGAVVQINMVLDHRPSFTGVPDEMLPGLSALFLGGSYGAAERACDAWKIGALAEAPPIELVVHPISNEGQSGRHLLSANLFYVPAELNVGQWDAARRYALGASTIKRLAALSPNLPDQIQHLEVITPDMFEQCYGVSGGHLLGAETAWDQWATDRRKGGGKKSEKLMNSLYFCGPGSRLFGYQTGRAGVEVARSLLQGGRSI